MSTKELQNKILINNEDVETRRIKNLYSYSHIYTAITFCLSVIASSVMWQSTNSQIFFYWFIISSIILSARLIYSFHFNTLIETQELQELNAKQTETWEKHFCVLLILTGFTWFALLYLCKNYSGMFETGVLYSCICTLVAVSIQAYSNSFKAYCSYSISILLPSSLYMIFSYEPSLQAIGHIGFYFFIVTLFVSWSLNRATIKGIRKELENLLLLQEMDAKNIELLKLNTQLEDDINARHLIEQKMLAEKQKVEDLNSKLLAMSSLDGLTGIANHYRFSEFLNTEWEHSARNTSPLTLLLCNIDHLSAYNENFGAQRGDRVICILANFLEDFARRGTDLAARLSGDKFALVFTSTNIDNAKNIAERLQQTFYELDLPSPKGSTTKYLTLSIGIASMIPSPENRAHELIDRADSALNKAKRDGRNRVSVARTLSLAADNTDNKFA